eukprot:scaffold86_cov338-Pavlova_lutheri.AAC.31
MEEQGFVPDISTLPYFFPPLSSTFVLVPRRWAGPCEGPMAIHPVRVEESRPYHVLARDHRTSPVRGYSFPCLGFDRDHPPSVFGAPWGCATDASCWIDPSIDPGWRLEPPLPPSPPTRTRRSSREKKQKRNQVEQKGR